MKKMILISTTLALLAPGYALGKTSKHCSEVNPPPHFEHGDKIDYKHCTNYGGVYAGEDNDLDPYCVIVQDGWCDTYEKSGCYIGPYCFSTNKLQKPPYIKKLIQQRQYYKNTRHINCYTYPYSKAAKMART